MGKRSTDYHGDALQMPTSLGRGVSSGRYYQNAGIPAPAHATERANYNVEELQPDYKPSCWQSFCQWITIPADIRHKYFKTIIDSRLWSSSLILFTIGLVFGAPIRDLICTQNVDDIFDILFLAIIGFFTVDIIMRMDVEPNYFVFRAFGRGQATSEDSSGCLDVQLGSFLFWCELCSTLALLYEVSLINPKHFGMQTIDIKINMFGSPVGCWNYVTRLVLLCYWIHLY